MKTLALVALIASASLTAIAQTNEPRPARTKTEQEVVAANQRYIDALVRKDGAALEGILADDFSETDTAIGEIKSKELFMAPYKSGAISDSGLGAIEAGDPKVSVHGGTAVLTVRATFKGQAADGQAYRVPVLLTSVFVKQRGRWRVIATHGTALDRLQAQTGALISK